MIRTSSGSRNSDTKNIQMHILFRSRFVKLPGRGAAVLARWDARPIQSLLRVSTRRLWRRLDEVIS